MSHSFLCMLAAVNYACHSTFLALHCRNDYCCPSAPNRLASSKRKFLLYSMEIKCVSLRLPNDYSYSLLIDLAKRTAHDSIRLRSAAVLIVPRFTSSNYPRMSKLPVLVQHPQVVLHTQNTVFHTQSNTVLSGAVNVKAPVPSILHLQTKINVNIQQYCCSNTIVQGFI
jgi:hypothetical protein